MVGQAVPSVSPGPAAAYLKKVECFCFNRQELQPEQSKLMPLKFYIDPALPDDINTITLSYSLYDITQSAPVPALAQKIIMAKVNQTYYVPDQSRWPIIGAMALFLLALGQGHLVNELASEQTGIGRYLMMAGVALLAFMLFGWFRHHPGVHDRALQRPDGRILQTRHGLVHLLRVMFFLAFFGVLFMPASSPCPGSTARATRR